MEKQMAKKLVTSHTFTGTFPSPGSPPGGEDGRTIENPKGWYSERVPDSSYRVRKGYVAAAALVPFSSGRALPSKWDDAERWISSPVSVGNVSTSSNYYCGTGVHNKASHLAYNSQRRAKSKSGPLGPAGLGFYGSPNYNTFSPVLGMGVINGGKWRNSIAVESPAEAGVQLEERLGRGDGGGDDGRRRSCPGHGDPEWLDLWSGPPSPSDKGDMNMPNDAMESINNDDDNNNYTESYNDDARVDRAISRRDMATQMYPESDSSCPSYAMSSPRSSISTGSPCRLLNQPNNSAQSFEFEVRDVQIDRQSSRATQMRPTSSTSPKGNEVSENSSFTTIVNEDNKMLKLQREEARINAWENLQKAKAESAIQKLEMKLEKKRATSMEKIIKKLRRAEIKAQKMKGSLDDHGSDRVQNRAISKNSSKIPSFCRKFRLIKSCSTCYLF